MVIDQNISNWKYGIVCLHNTKNNDTVLDIFTYWENRNGFPFDTSLQKERSYFTFAQLKTVNEFHKKGTRNKVHS